MQKRAVLILVLGLVITGISQAQNRTCYCGDCTMRGLTKLFIDTGDDVEARQNIIEVITKEFPSISIVERQEQAEIFINYARHDERRESDHVTEHRFDGKIEVVSNKGERRNVSTYTWRTTCKPQEKLEARRFARKFIDSYEAANY